MTYVEVYRLARAEELAAASTLFMAERDMTSAQRTVRIWEATIDVLRGDWAAAVARLDALLRHADLLPLDRMTALVAAGRLASCRGNRSADQYLIVAHLRWACNDEARDLGHQTGNLQRLGSVYAARLRPPGWPETLRVAALSPTSGGHVTPKYVRTLTLPAPPPARDCRRTRLLAVARRRCGANK